MDISQYKNVTIISHPVLTHKITKLRDKNTSVGEFRRTVKEISILEAYKALENLKTTNIKVITPIEETIQPIINEENICFVPILRAGLGMLEGFIEVLPNAKVGHIGMYRDETTHQPHEYMCRLPNHLDDKEVFLLDPMLATGGSGIDAVKLLKEHGVKHLNYICMIAAPEGVKAFYEAYPDIPLYIGCLDRQLNENAYICPGLGDAGDRIFGTIDD